MTISAAANNIQSKSAASSPERESILRAHYRFQQGRFFTEIDANDGAVHAASDLAIPMWNHSMWLGDDFEDFLVRTEEFHGEHGRRPIIYATESEARALESNLASAGYERFDRESWLIRSTKLDSENSSDFTSEPAADFDEFIRVFRAAFNANSQHYDSAIRREPEAGVAAQKHFIARCGEKAVAVGSVIFDGDLACIYNVGSAPRWRGRGAGRAVVEALIRHAREEGCGWVFLQVESGSGAERLYARIGFKNLFTRVGFRKTDWAEPAHESALSKHLGFQGVASGALVTETRSISKTANPKTIPALWALLLSRYTNQSEISFRLKLRNLKWQTARAVIAPQMPAAQWIDRISLTNDNDPTAETAVCFGSARPIASSSLLLNISDDSDSIQIKWRADLFSKNVVRRMADHLATLVASFEANPNRALRELEMLAEPERIQLLHIWSAGGDIKWNGENIVDLLEVQAGRTPNATALTLASSNSSSQCPSLTFAELHRRAAQRACALIRSGVTAGAAVGVLLPRSLEVVISMLAIWRAGAVFVPLDSSYPAERTAFMASDCRMKAIITDKTLASLAPEKIARIFADAEDPAESASVVRVEPKDPAYIIYTSGSTGQPKGVVIRHEALVQHVVAMRDFYEITAHDRHLHFSPFTFDASFEQLLPPLIAGASVVIRDDRQWDVAEFIRNLSVFDLTMVDIPTPYWRQLAQFSTELAADEVPARLRLVIAGGEAMSAERLAQWRRGPFGSRRLVNAYGPTEATITATAFNAVESLAQTVPIGHALPGRRIYILNDDLQPVPVRVPGQLFIGGQLLAAGYLNRPDLTAKAFLKNPFGDGQIYRTGDGARFLDDGSIEFLGRVDDQVKIRGFRVELGEIETTLQQHPSVREAIVVARAESDQKRLVAYVTPRGAKTSERELRQWLRARLPEYMTPSAVVVLDEFPLLTSGKVNRNALPSPPDESLAATNAAAPKNPLELQLQILFQRVLRRGGVGVDESFFELGGDSLQALELIVQIEKAAGKRLPLETLFQTPTVERLAAELDRASNLDEWSSLVPLQKSGGRPPIFLVHTTPGDVLGYGNLIHHLGSDQPCYGFQALGLKEGEFPHPSIEAMAAHYIELLREFQPRGPYHLGGWCFGGIVAVEMAQQLRSAGHQVGALLLMETNSASPGLSAPLYHLHRFKCLFTMSPARWREYLKAKAKYSETESRMRFRHAGDQVNPEQQRWLARLENVYNANLAALDGYRSRYYDGKITLFNAIERDPGVLPDPYYGWRGLAREIEIHEVAGNHDTMLAEPNVSSLANAMRNVLSKT